VQRRHRPLSGPADRVQRAGDADVVEVVADARRERTGLAPAGDPAVDQARVAGEALLRAEAHPLGDARPEPLDEHVRLVHQSVREMISFMISLVPPKIRCTRISAQARAIGYSFM